MNDVALLSFMMLFFFFKQKTAYEMRISDWSSDVCSSDLRANGSIKSSCSGLFHYRESSAGPLPNMKEAAEPRQGPDSLSHGQRPEAPARETMRAAISVGACVGWGRIPPARSEERRVGKECVSTCRPRWSRYHYKKHKQITQQDT